MLSQAKARFGGENFRLTLSRIRAIPWSTVNYLNALCTVKVRGEQMRVLLSFVTPEEIPKILKEVKAAKSANFMEIMIHYLNNHKGSDLLSS